MPPKRVEHVPIALVNDARAKGRESSRIKQSHRGGDSAEQTGRGLTTQMRSIYWNRAVERGPAQDPSSSFSERR
jgi:hypothetical protein